jgi:CheY-like chemotaxis protein
MAHILVVDDDPRQRATLSKILGRMGHDVAVAKDGVDALNTVTTQPFALAFVDLFMPRMDGLELIPKLMLQTPDTKIVAMSGGAFGGKALDLLRAAENLGAVRRLEKPYGVDEVQQLVEELIGRETS